MIVADGVVIGEGWHERAGEPHAEVNALADARARGRDPRGATLYVTLEPCNHQGRTPACTDAVIAAGLGRVVAAMADPNLKAADGAARLRAAGIAVEVGLLESEARELNVGFVSRMTRGRPWVRMKMAASLDGRTALLSGESKWITGEAARADGHHWRARACAILTGIGTVQQDDPQLSVRAVATPRQPRRIVIDRHAQTPPSAKVFTGNAALIVTAGERNHRRLDRLPGRHARRRPDLVEAASARHGRRRPRALQPDCGRAPQPQAAARLSADRSRQPGRLRRRRRLRRGTDMT